MPSNYLNQCWVIVNWTLRNQHQWNFYENIKLFSHENASENIVCEMAAIFSMGRWVNDINIGACHPAVITETTRTTWTPAFWDTPRRPMIIHTSGSHQIPCHKKTKSKLQIPKICQNFNFTLHVTHLLMLLDKMCKYEIDLTSIVEDTERTRFCPPTDRRTRWHQYTPLSTSLKRGV